MVVRTTSEIHYYIEPVYNNQLSGLVIKSIVLFLFTFQYYDTRIMTPPKPEQYFATPVPMSTAEFDQFLKENFLDVSTVTLPITQSNLEDVLLAKKKVYVQSPKEKSKKIESVVRTLKKLPFKTTIKLTDNYDTADETQILKDFESNLQSNYYDVKVQKKRMEGGNSEENLVNFDDYAINQKLLEDFKRKLKLFEKNTKKDVNQTSSGDVDVTVIDLNYDKHPDNKVINLAKLTESVDTKIQSGISDNITEPTRTKTLETPDETPERVQKPDELSYSIHNKLLYGPGKKIFSQIEEQDFTGRSNPDRFSKMFHVNMVLDNKVDDKLQLMGENTFGEITLDKKDDTEFGQDVTIYTPDTKQEDLPKLFQILSKMPELKENEQPNKIMISSQSYKYSVLFRGSDETTKTSNNRKYLNWLRRRDSQVDCVTFVVVL